MSCSLTFNFDTTAEMQTFLSEIGNDPTPSKPAKPAPKKRVPKNKKKQEAAEAEVELAEEPAEEPTEETLSLADFKKLAIAAVKAAGGGANGKAKLEELLELYGASNLTEIPEKDRAAVAADLAKFTEE